MESFNEVLVYFDDIANPTALDRLWCVFELYAACTISENSRKAKLSIIYYDQIDIDNNLFTKFDLLMEKVTGLDFCELLSINDMTKQSMINYFGNLEKGWIHVIDSIKTKLCEWLKDLGVREAESAQQFRNPNDLQKIDFKLNLGMFLVNLHKIEAQKCQTEARKLLERLDYDVDRKILKGMNEKDFKEKLEAAEKKKAAKALRERKRLFLLDMLNPKVQQEFNVKQFVASVEGLQEYHPLTEDKVKKITGMRKKEILAEKKRLEESFEEVSRNELQDPNNYSSFSSFQGTNINTSFRRVVPKGEDKLIDLIEMFVDLYLHHLRKKKDFKTLVQIAEWFEKHKHSEDSRLYAGMNISLIHFKLGRSLDITEDPHGVSSALKKAVGLEAKDKDENLKKNNVSGRSDAQSTTNSLKNKDLNLKENNVSARSDASKSKFPYRHKKYVYFYALAQWINTGGPLSSIKILERELFMNENLEDMDAFKLGCTKYSVKNFLLYEKLMMVHEASEEVFSNNLTDLARKVCKAYYGPLKAEEMLEKFKNDLVSHSNSLI